MTLPTWQVAGFGIYIHWPFCAAKCPYCDFNSHVRARVDQSAYLEAYLSQIDHWAELTGDRVVSSVFFGGGTPSLMDPDLTASMLERIAAGWTMANDLEVTLEANPTSVEAGRFRAFSDAGINRISVGIQSLRDDDLRRLGRLHSAAEARRAYDIARGVVDRVSFDLIYARQDQDEAAWRAELTEALAMGPDHLSLYQLTIEDGTAFGDRARAGRLAGLPNDDLSVALYDITQDLCGRAGLPRYEVSNHARPGQESRHNLVYWNAGDWLGIGPGAHGRVSLGDGRHATAELRQPERWRDSIASDGGAPAERTLLDPQEIVDEYVIFALRLREGLTWDRLAALGGQIDEQAAAMLSEEGLIERDETGLRTTERGVLLLNAIIAALRPT
jgi:oxygen-independent coproporphyrinogen-3 oxidase